MFVFVHVRLNVSRLNVCGSVTNKGLAVDGMTIDIGSVVIDC